MLDILKSGKKDRETQSSQRAHQDSGHVARPEAPNPALNATRIISGLESKLGPNCVRRYLGSGVKLESDDRGLLVSAGDRFTLDMIERRLGDELRHQVRDQLGDHNAHVSFSVIPNQPGGATDTESPRSVPGRQAGTDQKTERIIAGALPRRAPSQTGVQSRPPSCPSFESFLVGKSNQLAYGAVLAALNSGGSCPPVYVHGGCGLGKTHLLRSSAQRYRRMAPGSRVRYITGEAFTNSFIHAIRTKSVDAFEKKFRGLDVLCIDDVHLVAGKESTQQELLQIFNTLSLSGARIIIASDAPPNQIARLNSGLASRFAGGIVARIDAPDRELGVRLAHQICLHRGVSIDDRGLGTVLDRTGIGSGASVRDLEGSIVQIQAVARLLDQAPNSTLNRTSIIKALQLRNGTNSTLRARGPIPMDLIIRSVMEELGITRADLSGSGRHRTVVLARELIVHIARELTAQSFPEIAHAIGRPNHSTVITAAKRIKGRIESFELCRKSGPQSGITVNALVEELIDRIQKLHLDHSMRR